MKSRKILVVDPNLQIGVGGGVRVESNIVQLMVEEGNSVVWAGTSGYNLEELDAIHGTSLRYYVGKGLDVSHIESRKGTLSRMPLVTYHRYNRLVERLVKMHKPDVLITFDDIPKVKGLEKCGTKVVLYSHFPCAARVRFNLYEYDRGHEYKVSQLSLLRSRIMGKVLSRYLFTDYVPPTVYIIANSTVTGKFMRKLWGRVDTIIYPPINVPIQAFTEPQNDRKDDWVVSIGVLQPNKCFGELIQAFAHTSRGKLAIIGHRRDQGYFRWLLKKTIRRDLRHRVRILTDLSDIEKWRLIRRSKVISHQKRFEPFGIAVAEGMYAGAVPIVFKGCTSGPWIDIVDKGEYGFGYEDVGELTSYIDLILSEPDLQNKYAAKSKERARMFTYKNFKQQWMDVLKKL